MITILTWKVLLLHVTLLLNKCFSYTSPVIIEMRCILLLLRKGSWHGFLFTNWIWDRCILYLNIPGTHSMTRTLVPASSQPQRSHEFPLDSTLVIITISWTLSTVKILHFWYSKSSYSIFSLSLHMLLKFFLSCDYIENPSTIILFL